MNFNYKHRLRFFVLLDLIYVVITGYVLHLGIKSFFINLFFNPITFSIMLIIFMFVELSKHSRFLRINQPKLWDTVRTGIYPELINIKWIFSKNNNDKYSVFINEKIYLKKMISTTYILFVVNVLIMVLVMLILDFIA